MQTWACRCAVIVAILCLNYRLAAQEQGPTLLKSLGYKGDARVLIIHADDVGMSHSVNSATFYALKHGYVTSASVMVPCPWFDEAADFARRHPEYDFGLHLTLTSEWKPYRWRTVSVDSVPSLIDHEGYLWASSRDVGKHDMPTEVALELQAQIDRAHTSGVAFSHLDNHMGGLSQNLELFKTYLMIARNAHVMNYANMGEWKAYRSQVTQSEFDIPIPQSVELDGKGQQIDQYIRAFSHLGPGFYVMIVHLGYDDDELRAIMGSGPDGAAGRQADLRMVSDARFRSSLRHNHIHLVSWKEIAMRCSQYRRGD